MKCAVNRSHSTVYDACWMSLIFETAGINVSLIIKLVVKATNIILDIRSVSLMGGLLTSKLNF